MEENIELSENSKLIINWFPGHMHRTRKLIAQHLSHVDMVIELRDARIPFSSSNPLLKELTQSKPVLIILNKADLADDAVTKEWIDFYSSEGYKVFALSSKEPQVRQKIVAQCKKVVPIDTPAFKKSGRKRIRAMITGIPNVGKSTLLNTLSCSAKAKTGDRPAVTTDIQSVRVEGGVDLIDTPGVLWPKIETLKQGICLSAAGSIKDDVVDTYQIAVALAKNLLASYGELLKVRYKCDNLPALPAELIELVGKKRGCLQSGGIVDLQKAALKFLQEFRSGSIGKISLERLSDWGLTLQKKAEEKSSENSEIKSGINSERNFDKNSDENSEKKS